MNLASIIDAHPDDAPALISRRKVTTYGELRQQVGAMRGGLQGLGIETGDRVAVACGNNWYFVVSYLAALGAGSVVVPVNPSAPAPELAKYLQVTGAKLLIAGPAANHSAGSLDRAALSDLEHVVATAGVTVDGELSLDDLLTRSSRGRASLGPSWSRRATRRITATTTTSPC